MSWGHFLSLGSGLANPALKQSAYSRQTDAEKKYIKMLK